MSEPGEGGAATRLALLRAARRRFSQHGYADVTLRDIAADAGVSAALVVKYFTSKEDLYAEAVSFEADAARLLDAPLERLGAHLVTTQLSIHEATQGDPLLRAVFTATRPGGTRFRENFEQQFVQRLTGRLGGPDAALRAELICALMMGLAAARLALRSPALLAESDEAIVARFGPQLQALVDGSDVDR